MNAHKAQSVGNRERYLDSEVLRAKQRVLMAFLPPLSRPYHVFRPVLDEVATTCAGRTRAGEAPILTRLVEPFLSSIRIQSPITNQRYLKTPSYDETIQINTMFPNRVGGHIGLLQQR